MLVALIIVAALAAILAVALWLTRQSAAEFRTQADRRESALVSERQQLTEEKTSLQTELATAGSENQKLTDERNDLEEERNAVIAERNAVTGERDEVTAERDEARGDARRLAGELDKARKASDEQAIRVTHQAEEISGLTADNAGLRQRAEVAEAEAAAIAARDSGIVIGELDSVGSQPETLWDLEMARSERTWRTSVAINPAADTSPFDDTDDPLRLAVEIEAAALRENVGTFITIDWRASPVADPARRHLIARVAQELLEAAARGPEASRLVVEGDDEVTLRLESAEDGDKVVNIIPPRITSDLIDVRSETGINIIVKAP